jgi:hypothetical protein
MRSKGHKVSNQIVFRIAIFPFVRCHIVVGYCLALRSQLGRQSHNGQRLPALFANNLKINSSNSIDKPSNPLKQGISHNHKQGANPKASVNFQALGQANH